MLFVSACSHQASKTAADWCTIKGMPLTGRVVDGANVLNEEQEAALTKELALLEARTHHQLVVATVSSLEGVPIAEYSLCQARRWEIGRKDFNDGVLLLVAPKDRKVRIEVGYGLEKPLRDDEAAKIVDTMLPSFAQSRYFDGIQTGTRGIASEIGMTQ